MSTPSFVARAQAHLRALSALEPPFAFVDLQGFDRNAQSLVERARGKPIRVASKSVRCLELLRRVLARPGFSGVLAFTLPEALWLASHGIRDVVVGYPSVDAQALRGLAGKAVDPAYAQVTLMVDSIEQLELIEKLLGGQPGVVRVCMDLDAGFRVASVALGAKRSPVHTVEQAEALAQGILNRPRFKLVGLMAYEAQIAGVQNRPAGRPLFGVAVRAMQSLSAKEIAARRAEVVRRVRALCPLEFVNGGGTGSLETTAKEDAVTEVAAGSGLYAPALFDGYRAFHPQPAAFFVLPVVRRPGPGVVTVLGGGYVASGKAGADRLPVPVYPEGLELDGEEGAGEVQTPLIGAAADRLTMGDRVIFRHAKAGELCERFDVLHLVDGDAHVGAVPTYRGEGKCFL